MTINKSNGSEQWWSGFFCDAHVINDNWPSVSMSGLTFERTNVVDWPVPKHIIPGFTYYHSDKASDLFEQGSN